MASEKLPNVSEEKPWAVDLCHRPSEAGFRVSEKSATLYFFSRTGAGWCRNPFEKIYPVSLKIKNLKMAKVVFIHAGNLLIAY